MPKSRLQKAEMLARYERLLADSKLVVVFSHDGLNVSQSEELRSTLFEHGEKLVVMQNRLLRLALSRLGLILPEEVWGRPLGVAVSESDEVTISKDLAAFIKNNENVSLVAGIYEGRVIPTDMINELAKLPSREELLAKLVGTIAAPVSGLVNVLAGTMRGLVTALKQIEDQKAS